MLVASDNVVHVVLGDRAHDAHRAYRMRFRSRLTSLRLRLPVFHDRNEVRMFCSQCGAPNDNSFSFCQSCGAQLRQSPQMAAEPVQPSQPAEPVAEPAAAASPATPAAEPAVQPKESVGAAEPAAEPACASQLAGEPVAQQPSAADPATAAQPDQSAPQPAQVAQPEPASPQLVQEPTVQQAYEAQNVAAAQQPYAQQAPAAAAQPFAAQNPYAGQQQYASQQPYAGQQQYAAQQPYAGQQPYTAQQPYGAGAQPCGAQPVPGARPVYAEGCVAAAWNDVKGTPGWFGKACLLSVIGIVPILNWVIAGFLLRWSSKLSFGRREPMPRGVFEDSAFTWGFYNFVLTLLSGFVGGIIGGILGFIPLIGVVLAIAVSLFLSVLVYVMMMRASVVGRFGAAFDLQKVFSAIKREPGSLCFAVIVPVIISGIVVSVIVTIAVFLMLAVVGVSASTGAYIASADPTYMTYLLLAGAGIPSFILVIVAALLSSAAIVVTSMVVMRAVGHWVSRFAPEWASEVFPPVSNF